MVGGSPSIYSYLKNIDWRSHEDRVVLISIITVLSVLVSAFFEPSLGLSAICLILWVEVTIELSGKVEGKWWRRTLQFASKMWFLSGILFAFTVILETGFNPTSVVPIAPTALTDYFASGVVALGFAIASSYLLLDYVVVGKANASAFIVFDAMLTGLVVLFDGIYFVSLITIPPERLVVPIIRIYQIELVGAILSSVVIMLTLREWSYRRLSPFYFIFFLPTITALAYYLGLVG